MNYAAQKSEEYRTLLLARKADNGGQENTWYLDTGASNYMSEERSMFVELNDSVCGNISFGDDSKIPVKGKSNMLIRLRDGRHQFCSNIDLLCAQHEEQHFEFGTTLRERL